MMSITRILSARKMNDADKENAFRRGFLIVDEDYLSFKYLSDDSLADMIRSNTYPFIFTSQHAIQALMKMIHQYQITLKTKDCYCIHGITKQNAIENGFNLLGEAGNSSDLAQEIIKNGQTDLVFLSGNIKRREMINILTSHKISVNDYVVYHKSLIPIEVPETYEGIMFFSPSQIDAFNLLNHLPHDIPAFCIGTTTADYLQLTGHKNIIISEHKNTKSILNKIYEYYI